MKFAVYSETGAIRSVMSGVESDIAGNLADGEGYIAVSEDVAGSTHYVDVLTKVVVEKSPLILELPDMFLADGETVVSLSVAPDGATVRWPDGELSADFDGFTGDQPGEYEVIVYHPHYLPWRKIIHGN